MHTSVYVMAMCAHLLLSYTSEIELFALLNKYCPLFLFVRWVLICVYMLLENSINGIKYYTHIHAHSHLYIYIYICVCVCVCVPVPYMK